MKVKKINDDTKVSSKKRDPRLEFLLERRMDQMPRDTVRNKDPFTGLPVSVADPALYNPPKPDYEESIKKGPSESLLEDIAEFIDPTGIFSHNDAERAYASYVKRKKESGADFMLPTFDEFLDVLGAVPMLGKFGKLLKFGKGTVDLAKAIKASKNIRNADYLTRGAGFVADRTEQYRDEN